MTGAPAAVTDTSAKSAIDRIASSGLILFLLLLLGVGGVLWHDYRGKIDDAHDRTEAFALDTDQLVTYQLRNLARAMQGVVGDAAKLRGQVPAQSAVLIAESVHDIATRHEELASLDVVDAEGRSLIGGVGDASLPAWFPDPRNHAGKGELAVGAASKHGGDWLLPLAVAMPADGGSQGGWVLAQLRLSALDPIVEGMDLGKNGRATLLHLDGTVLARSLDPGQLGRKFPEAPELQGAAGSRSSGEDVGSIDGLARIRAYRHLEDYPVVVDVSVARAEVLAPWWQFVITIVLASVLYGLAWQSLARRKRRLVHEGERLQQQVHSGEERLERARDQYRFLFHKNPLPLFIYDPKTRGFLEVNEKAEQTYGYTREEFLARKIDDIRPVEDLPRLEAAMAELPPSSSGQVWRHRRKDGSLMNVLVESTTIDFDGEPARFVLAQDVTERLANEERLAFHASHDAATGLANREALITRLDAAIGAAAAAGHGVTIVYVQVNHLSQINDSLGHAVGDEVMAAVAARLRDRAPDPDMVARIGGDEFAFVVPDGSTESLADLLAGVRAALAEPLTALGTMHQVTANIGHARFPEHGDDAGLLVKHAGLAAHEAKRLASRDALEFSPVLEHVLRERLDLVARLQDAIARGEFELFYQPQYRASDRRPIGVEALIRWRHPERGLVPPAVFIAICEDSGLIVPLGQWVLREACRAYQRLVAAGWTGVSVAINVSQVQFQSGHLVDDVRATLAEFAIPRGGLELELTESIVMENSDAAISTLHELKALGARLSIDDFGTGYSSMSYLRRLPVDKLKIDREFVNHVDQDEKNAAICETIIAIGHRFGMQVIAEGVETLPQLEWLRERRCDALQGYVLARPQSFDDMLAGLGIPR